MGRDIYLSPEVEDTQRYLFILSPEVEDTQRYLFILSSEVEDTQRYLFISQGRRLALNRWNPLLIGENVSKYF